jgi:hypothetical protein
MLRNFSTRALETAVYCGTRDFICSFSNGIYEFDVVPLF